MLTLRATDQSSELTAELSILFRFRFGLNLRNGSHLHVNYTFLTFG